MSTAAATFSSKGVFHSALVKASQGGLALMFTGPVRDSKYPGKPAYIPFKVHGEEGEHTLNIENDTIRKTLEGLPDKVWLVVRADGTRDMAWINVEDTNGNLVTKGIPVMEIAQPKPSQMDAPPNEWREVTGPHPVELDEDPDAKLRATLAKKYFLALCAADDAVQRFAKEHAGSQPSDAVRNIATTIFIQASGR